MEFSTRDGDGRAGSGFKESEVRRLLGNTVYRKLHPFTESKTFGLDYECWEVSGPISQGVMLHFLPDRADKITASRIDVAFDFECDPDVIPEQVRELVAPHARDRRTKMGQAEEDGISTQYIGSKSSDRRVRIYRKDLREPSLIGTEAPLLRLEVMLRDDHADGLLRTFYADGLRGMFSAAAAHLGELTGLSIDGATAVPSAPNKPDADVLQLAFHFYRQHACTIDAMLCAGVDLAELAHVFTTQASRSALVRRDRLIDRLADVDPTTLKDSLMDMLRQTERTKERRDDPARHQHSRWAPAEAVA